MKLKTKLLGAFFIVLLLTAGIGFTGIIVARNISVVVSSITTNLLPSLGYISQVDASLAELRWNQLRYITLIGTREEAKSDIDKSINDVKENMDKFEATISSVEQSRNWDKFTIEYADYLKGTKDIIQLVKDNKADEALMHYNSYRIAYDGFKENINFLVNLNKSNGIKAVENTVNLETTGQYIVIAIMLIAILLGIGIALIISKNITETIKVISLAIGKVADGDLTVAELRITTKDEIGLMAGMINKMVENLRTIVQKVVESSHELAASSEELSASSEETTSATEHVATTIGYLATGADNQSQEVQHARTVVNEMSANVQQVAKNSRSVTESSIKVSMIANQGLKEANNAVDRIEQINRVSSETASVIKGLVQEMEKIGQIIDVIKGIADQTNLLALNAAIEAARAGENGRGFAVVAEEVRKLAEQSVISAQSISELINSIQKETNLAVNVIELGSKEVALGVVAVKQVGDSFKVIADELNGVVEEIKEVADIAQELTVGSNKVIISIENIADVADKTAASSQEVTGIAEEQTASMEGVAKSAQDLAILAGMLQELVKGFKS
ncbi:methyl-accepting chemotaxis protein [Desulfosporosinus sp. BICA1-9]|uniref:methyl-accepting chemotaxis protein n=1 Tax=Desulfosporosinus sp. BICA1-9 TaxID=1531958 RepID=UPI000A54812B|nr:methyl-accepting chemotaxis protein [Desulfosporosinus sp. BICA1-9]